MNENKLLEELKKVTVKEEQVKRLVEAESLEAFRQILAECGAEIGEEEAKGLYEGLKEQKDGELSLDSLDQVSGGIAPAVVAIGAGVAFLYGFYRGMRKRC